MQCSALECSSLGCLSLKRLSLELLSLECLSLECLSHECLSHECLSQAILETQHHAVNEGFASGAILQRYNQTNAWRYSKGSTCVRWAFTHRCIAKVKCIAEHMRTQDEGSVHK